MVNAKLLRGKIAEAGLNQEKLAEMAGMSMNSLSRKINGKRSFRLEEVLAICIALDIDDPRPYFFPDLPQQTMTKPRYPNLAAEMHREGITGKAMASGLGVHHSGFYLILQGKRTLSISMARRIKEQFFPDLTLDYLFEVEDERKVG